MKIQHETDLRLRFWSGLIGKDLNRTLFISKLKLIQGVNDARVSLATKTFVVHFERGFKESIKKECLKLDLQKYISVDEQFSFEEDISKAGIVRSLGALGISYFLGGAYAKLATYAAITPLVIKGVKALATQGVNSTSLEALAVGVSAYTQDYTAANSTNFLLEVGEYIEETTVKKSDDLLQELIKPNVENVWILDKGAEKFIAYKDLKLGDIVIVNAGDTIAIDGHITKGTGLVNQSSMTGEALSVERKRGDKVLSGTVLEEGRIYVWAESVGAETATARIGEYIKSSLETKSLTQQKANALADKLVPMTLGLAFGTYAFTQDLNRFSSVLQADYSCALKLSTPVAFRSSISKLGKSGIIVKGADILEELSSVDTFVFDKTGTLTRGELEVVEVFSFKKNWTKDKILNLAASAEEHYFHPVAQAVVEAAKRQDFVHIHHEEVKFIVAHGVSTQVDGKKVVIGSRHFLQDDEQIDFAPHAKLIEQKENQGRTILYIGFNKELLGMIALNDTIRDNSKEVIEKLLKNGVKNIIMLTGDNEQKAKEIASFLGIKDVRYELKPTQKADIVKALVKSGAKVAFVGDGINDAPALVSANVGISMARGADVAKASADVSLLVDDVYGVLKAKIVANETMKLINTNFKTAVGTNSLILLGATFGTFSPIVTSFLHNGTTVGLLLNSLRGVKAN